MTGENLNPNSGEGRGDPLSFVQDDSPESTCAPEAAFAHQESRAASQQLELDWGDVSFSDLDSDSSTAASRKPATQKPESRKPPTWEQAYRSRQIERICYLEKALDQCQVYINELKLQLADQQFLEAQLAATEEMSHIQQQAITALKIQLANQQGADVLIARVSQPVKALQTEMDCPETRLDLDLAEEAAHQAHLEQQVTDLQVLLQTQQQHTENLESQNASTQGLTVNLVNQLGSTQKKVTELQNKLSDRQAKVTDLEAQLQRTKVALSTQQEITAALQQIQAPESEKNKVIQGLSKNLLNAHTKIEALETEFSYQLKLQTRLQHSCQELEAQSSIDQERIAELEQQVAEMQEQILKQAQQASEYEAAVQHWKDRYLAAEHSVLQLKSVLEGILKDRPDNLSELMTAIGSDEPSQETDPPTANSVDSESSGIAKGLKVNLPGFLNLRRNHQK